MMLLWASRLGTFPSSNRAENSFDYHEGNFRGYSEGTADLPRPGNAISAQPGFCLRIRDYPTYSGGQFNRRSVVLENPGTIRSPSAPKVDNVIPGLSTSILEPRPPFHV